MSPIYGLGSGNPVHKAVNPNTQRPAAAEPTSYASATDKLELSGASHLLASLKNSDVRTDKVASVRAQIQAGKYESDRKMDIAISRLMDDLNL